MKKRKLPPEPKFEWQKLYRIYELSTDGLLKFYNREYDFYQTELEAMRAVENELKFTGEWDTKTRNHLLILPFYNVKKIIQA